MADEMMMGGAGSEMDLEEMKKQYLAQMAAAGEAQAPAPTEPEANKEMDSNLDRAPASAPPSLNDLAKALATGTKSEKKAALSDATGVDKKELNDKTMGEVSSKMRGAAVASARGVDPLSVPQASLAKLDPEQGVKESEVKEQTPEELDNHKKLMMALTAAIPTVLGYALGGYSGGAAGAQAGGQAVEGQYKEDLRQGDLKREAGEKAKDRALKERGVATDEKRAQIEEARRINEVANHKDQRAIDKEKLALERRRIENDYIMKQMDMQQQQTGKPLAAEQADKLSGHLSSLKTLDDLDQAVSNNAKIFGPATGRLNQLNPYDTRVQAVNAQLKTAAQNIGKSLEGGKLTDQDIARYEKMLPKLSDTTEVANGKLQLLRRMVVNKQSSDLDAFGKAGSNVGRFSASKSPELITAPEIEKKSLFGPKQAYAGEAPANKPDFSKMSQEELKKYLGH